MSYFEIITPRFRELIIPVCAMERLYTGTLWAEGPVYFGDSRHLVFSDIPNNRMLKWEETTGQISTFRAPSNFSNGNTRDRQGRLVTCEHGTRRVTRTETDGSITVLVDRVDGKRFNSPNDAVVAADDAIWFTDPTYGILTDYEGYKAESEIGRCDVYRLDPRTGEVRVVATGFTKPNGLAFSPDGRTLYVADSGQSHDPDGPHHVRAFDVGDNGELSNDRVFAMISPGIPDGLRIDEAGRAWISAADGVHCYEKDGELIGKILVPETVANLCFGGPRRNRLFITATTSLYSVFVNTSGAQRP
jgi:gluconolactonase